MSLAAIPLPVRDEVKRPYRLTVSQMTELNLQAAAILGLAKICKGSETWGPVQQVLQIIHGGLLDCLTEIERENPEAWQR